MAASLFSLQGKLALLTGSTAGIGKAAARAFVQAGACVLVNGRKADVVQAAVDELNQEAGEGFAVPAVADVVSKEGVAVLADTVAQQDRPLDIFVNNVGIFGVQDFFEIPDEEWERYWQTNILSTVRCCRTFLKPMLERKTGRIVVVSSEAGYRGFATMAHYAMTKTAQLGLVRSMSALTKGTDVTVNAVMPGPTYTEGMVEYMKGVAAQKGVTTEEATALYFKENEPTSLLQRFLRPEEIASTILFLASEAGSGVNGTAQRAEGGIIRGI